jgi:hypothetical protein
VPEDQLLLEYELTPPPPDSRRFSLARLLALGYVALCVAGLVTMGLIMALNV